MEISLTHPVELDGTTYSSLKVASYDAIMKFRTNSAEQVIRSLSLVYGVPRRMIRKLHENDANRAGDLIVSLLDAASSPWDLA
jgi:hypothetical protein